MIKPLKGLLRPGHDTPPALTEIQTPDILDLLLDAVLLVDAEGICLSASAACENNLGYTADELVGKSLYGFVHPDDRAETLRVAELVRRGRRDGPSRNSCVLQSHAMSQLSNELRRLNSNDPAQARYQDDAKEWLGVPLKIDTEVIGAIVVKNYDGDYRYHEDDETSLGFVSTHIALAIQRKQTDERLQHMAHHDPLTHLPNRALFNDRVDMAIARAERQQDKVAILYLDLDQFKPVNDRYGHEIDDRLLQALASRLMVYIRDSDTIGRMGGDEFAMLFCGLHHRADLDRVVLQVQAAFA